MFGQSLNFGGFGGGSAPVDIDFLLVGAGGGGGGRTYNILQGFGGGGGGGLKTSYGSISGGNCSPLSKLTFNPGITYTINVGSGGAGGTYNSETYIGGNTYISGSDITTITALGGGAARGHNSVVGYYSETNNGPGAGGPSPGFAISSCQGFDGGNANTGGGGGGSPAGAGGNTSSSNGGGGAAGMANSITGTSIYYGGGGGGGSRGYTPSSPCNGGSGGAGGGGNGGNCTGSGPSGNGVQSGTANTGGGGGGQGGNQYANYTGGNGGSGIAILRIPTANYSGITTGSPTVTTDGSDTILKFTGSGSYTH